MTLPFVASMAMTLPAAAQSAAQDAAIEKVVVLDLQVAKPELKGLGVELSDLLVSSTRSSLPGAQVIGQAEIKAMLSLEQQKLAVGCEDDTSCLAEIGGALGADHLVIGRLGKIGSVYLVSIRLIHTPSASVLRQVSEKVSGSEEQLIEVVSQGAAHLVNPDKHAAPTVSQSTTQTAPAAATQPAASVSTLDDDDSSILTSPWLWVGVGVVVIGVVAVIAISSSGGDEPSGTGNGQVSGTFTPTATPQGILTW